MSGSTVAGGTSGAAIGIDGTSRRAVTRATESRWSAAERVSLRAVRIGAVLTFAAVAVQGWILARLHPAASMDADLLSYMVYFRQLASGVPVPFGYTVPKVLPVLLLGPLGDPGLAQATSVLVAAAGGAVLFVLAARTFGIGTAVLGASLYVLDPLRGVLTLRSSVDLYIGVALLGATLALRERAVVAASVLILLAALGKPIAAPCALAILAVPGVPRARRLLAVLLPFLAIPASVVLAAALAGEPVFGALLHPVLPDQHEKFVRVAQASALGLGSSLELLVVEWFGGTLFARSWLLVVAGAGLYLGTALWRGREAGDHGLILLVPLLLCGAYLGLAAFRPMIVFTRFFWPLAAVLGLLAAYGAWSIAERAPGGPVLRGVLLAVFAAALLLDRWDDHRWRQGLMLDPFESHAEIAARGIDAIGRPGICDGPVVVPLAYLPQAAWSAPDRLARGELCSIEDWADGRGCADPSCVLHLPAAPTTERARNAIGMLVRNGFVVEVGNEHGALVRSSHG